MSKGLQICSRSCVVIEKKNEFDTDYVLVKSNEGDLSCGAQVGYERGERIIHLGKPCFVSVALNACVFVLKC